MDTSQYLVQDEMVSMDHLYSKQDLSSVSEMLFLPTLSMSQVQEHLQVSVSLQEHQVDTYSLLMLQVILVGQVTHQQLPMSMLHESLVLHEVEDISLSSWRMALV